MSLFQGLIEMCMQEWYLGRQKVSLLERCPQFPYRVVPLYVHVHIYCWYNKRSQLYILAFFSCFCQALRRKTEDISKKLGTLCDLLRESRVCVCVVCVCGVCVCVVCVCVVCVCVVCVCVVCVCVVCVCVVCVCVMCVMCASAVDFARCFDGTALHCSR